MKKLLVYLKDYKKESILGPLFKLLEASFELLVPLVVTKIIDVGIATGDVHYIVRMVLLMVGLALIGLICSITAQYFAAKAAVGFAAGLKSALFRHIQSLSYSEMDHLGTASLITRMTSDVNQLQSGVNLVLRLFLRSPFIVFGAMVMAFTIDVRSALVFAVAIPLLSVVVFGIMLLTMPLYRRAQAGLDRLLRRTRENLSGVRVIRAFHKEAEETAQFAEENESLTRLQLFVGRISALMNPLTYVLINGAIVALIWTGAWQVERGALTQGQVVALVNYMSQILIELIKLANLIITITKAAACARRIESVPVPMVISGYYLSKADLRTIWKHANYYITIALRLAVIPLCSIGLMFLLQKAFRLDGMLLAACIVDIAAPVAAATTMFSTLFRQDSETAANLVSISTLLSVLTLPIMVALAQSVFL